MDGLDRFFCKGLVVGRQLDDIVKGIFKADDVEMFTQWLFGDGNAFLKNQGCFTERQYITFDGIGIVRRLNDELLAKLLPLCRIQWGQAIQSVLQKIDFGKEGIHGEAPFKSFLVSNFTMMSPKKQQIPLKQVRC